MQMPVWTFFAVAAIVYVMYGVVLYRLIALDLPLRPRIVCLTGIGRHALQRVLELPVLRPADPDRGAGLADGVRPALGFRRNALFLFESVSGFVLLPYGVYILVYNVPWGVQLCILNPPSAGPAPRP